MVDILRVSLCGCPYELDSRTRGPLQDGELRYVDRRNCLGGLPALALPPERGLPSDRGLIDAYLRK